MDLLLLDPKYLCEGGGGVRDRLGRVVDLPAGQHSFRTTVDYTGVGDIPVNEAAAESRRRFMERYGMAVLLPTAPPWSTVVRAMVAEEKTPVASAPHVRQEISSLPVRGRRSLIDAQWHHVDGVDGV